MLLERHERAIEECELPLGSSFARLQMAIIGIPQRQGGLVPDHHNKVSCHDFTGGGSCLPFIKNKQKPTISVRHKHSEAQQKKGGL